MKRGLIWVRVRTEHIVASVYPTLTLHSQTQDTLAFCCPLSFVLCHLRVLSLREKLFLINVSQERKAVLRRKAGRTETSLTSLTTHFISQNLVFPIYK